MPQQHFSTAVACAEASEWEVFYRLITHDDRNSYYVVSSDASGSWVDTAVKKESLPALGFNATANFYMTHNGFTSCCRKADQTRQLNALFFDLDCHDRSETETRDIVSKTIKAIEDAVQNGTLPEPTMLIDSGRGVQLFFVLERSIPCRIAQNSVNEKGVTLFQYVQKQLASVIGIAIKHIDGIAVDKATFDVSRVSRIPGTYNAKAKRFAKLVHAANRFYSLSYLAGFTARFAVRALSTQKNQRAFGRTVTIVKYQPLMISRLGKLIELQKHRQYNCEGTRELMSFVFYNTAVQIYPRANAVERLHAFNARFTAPLPASELEGIVSSVDSVVNVRGEQGYYLIGAQRLTELLALTPQEIVAVNFFESRRTIQRKEAKRTTARKRKERNSRIVELHAQGFTQAAIANAVSCSVRTVASVLKTTKQHKQQAMIYNKLLANRYNNQQSILCNFLSYESLKCFGHLGYSHPVQDAGSSFASCKTASLRSLHGFMTKTLCSATFVTSQRVPLVVLFGSYAELRFALMRFVRLVQ